MSALDRPVFAERVMAVERHLGRVRERLVGDPALFLPSTDASDAVILHLWQAIQIVIDLAVSACIHLKLGAPATYADTFHRLAAAGHLEHDLAARLVRAAGFRNVIAHAYAQLDMARVHRAASEGPTDLMRFLAAVRTIV